MKLKGKGKDCIGMLCIGNLSKEETSEFFEFVFCYVSASIAQSPYPLLLPNSLFAKLSGFDLTRILLGHILDH